ncbi:hypothetical protein [Dactylosporangium fulvum]|uniref:Uncharacterized protein n=1 Tax=Dactylosporangium fulvum TaxID=53359 RepID=A0ABY5VVI6_9ACTN|nr:hypothetical protein [Dactylosporangium fulvum]UWP81768.1 hypothetical protein Dfulv_42840 [Dactylosporangium fulvum]
MTACAGFWWLAVPRFNVCAAVLPAPAGCGDRVPIATLWTAIVAVLYVATAIVAFARPHGHRWPFATAITALTIAALWGYRTVLYNA